MKKNLLLFFFSLAVSAVIAQQRPGKKYINFGYVNNKLSPIVEGLNKQIDFKSDFGAFFSTGSTYFVHPNPVAKLLHFGIDVTFVDLTYSQFKFEDNYVHEDSEGNLLIEEDYIDLHKGELGIQIGPSVHLRTVQGLGISGYMRFAPSYSFMYGNDEFSSGFAPLFTSGITLNYKFFGIGIETRWGKTKHTLAIDVDELEEIGESSVDQKFDIKGNRIFLAFRF